MRKQKKCLITIVLLIMFIGVFTACNDDGFDNKYNAVLYDNCIDWINEEYKSQNLTYGAFVDDEFINNLEYPKYTIKLIQQNEEFDIAFKEFPIEVNLNNRIIILYFFTCDYMGREYKITDININGNDFIIDLDLCSVGDEPSGGVSIPQQRCLAIVVDNCLDVITKNIKVSL